MGAVKRQVNDVLDLWCQGYSIVRIAGATELTPEMVEFIINEYGEDVMEA